MLKWDSSHMVNNREKNALLNFREAKEEKASLRSFPHDIYIEFTRSCNIRCPMCGYEKINKDMPIEVYKKIIETTENKVSRVFFHLGGESTLVKDFPQRMNLVKDEDFIKAIYTNLCVPKAVVENLVKYFDFIYISLGGADKEVCETVQNGTNFGKVLENIRYLMMLIKQNKAEHIRVRFHVVGQKPNIHQLQDVIKLADKLNVPEVSMSIIDREKEFPYSLDENPKLTMEMFKKALISGSNLGIRTSVPKSFKGITLEKSHNWNDFELPCDKYHPNYIDKYVPVDNTCPWPWLDAIFRFDGTVETCPCEGATPMGNIMKEDFVDIWNNEKYQNLRKEVNCNPPGKCYNCKLRNKGIFQSVNIWKE